MNGATVKQRRNNAMKIRNTSNFVTALVIFISVITVILCVSIVETRSAATVNAVKPEEYVADYLEERLVEDYTKATGRYCYNGW